MLSVFSHPGVTVYVHESSVEVLATEPALHDWATRPHNAWPCSALAELNTFYAEFDANGVLDSPPEEADLTADEFNAFTRDCLAYALNPEHPCYFITVGQFITREEQG